MQARGKAEKLGGRIQRKAGGVALGDEQRAVRRKDHVAD